MADINYTASTLKKSYTRRIGDHGFLGADFSTAPIFASDRRFRDLKNVWKDHKSGSGVAIETVPGFRIEAAGTFDEDNYEKTINNIFRFDVVSNGTDFGGAFGFQDGTYIGVHIGRELHFFRPGDPIIYNEIGKAFHYVEEGDYKYVYVGGGEPITVQYKEGTFAVLPDAPSIAIQNKNTIVILCNGNAYTVRRAKDSDLESSFFVYDGGLHGTTELECGFFVEPLNAYTPTTYLNGLPYEQKNMLSVRSKERYTEVSTLSEQRNDGNTTTTVYYVSVRLHEKVPEGSSPYKSNIVSVKLDGNPVSASNFMVTRYQGYITNIRVDTSDHSSGGTHTIEVEYASDPALFTSYRDFEDYKDKSTFNEGNPGYSGTAYDAIAGCTICASFDERIFLAGNPRLPNTVFYSQRDLTGYNNPTYFGVLNYNNLGTSNAPITAMIPSANALYVLKDDSATDPTMYVLTGLSTEKDLIPRIYTVESGLPGIGCKGAACNFLDDIVFMSRNGVIGIDKQAVNLERTLGDRSVLINGKLLLEDVTQAVFAEAEGYLWVLFKNNGHVYLADSRAYTQGAGYEWYFIDSVGSWSNDADYYEYTDEDVARNGATTVTDAQSQLEYTVTPSKLNGEQFEGGSGETYTISVDGIEHDVILVEDEDGDGNTVYHQVVKTGEKVCTDSTVFHPATCMVASNDRIFFGTDNGDLLTFNNDKRGVQAESEIVSGTTYGENRYPFMLRPEWYSFCGHRIESFVETSDDDGGIGNLTKDTVRRSAVVDLKAMLGSKYRITTYTDRDGWKNDNAATGSMNDASQTMLDAVNFSGDEHINVQIRERSRKWVHKRYRIESEGFCSPFGLYRITYNFEINGRIK